MVEFDGEEMVISFCRVSLEFSMVEVDEEPFFWITIHVVSICAVALLAGIHFPWQAYYSLSPFPPLVAGFYLALTMFRILFQWTCYVAEIFSHFWKKNIHFLWGWGDEDNPKFDFMRSIWLKKIFCTNRGEQGRKRWTDVTWYFFCIGVAYLLVSKLIFFI